MPNLLYSVLVLVNVCICWNSYAPADPPHGILLNIVGDAAEATGYSCPHSSSTGCLRIKELQLCQQHASHVEENSRMKYPNQPDHLYRFHVQNFEFHHDQIYQTLRARFPDASVIIHKVLSLPMEEEQEWTVFGTNFGRDITLKSKKVFALLVCAHCVSEPASPSQIVFLVFNTDTLTSTSATRLLNPLDHPTSVTASNDKMIPHNLLPSSDDFHLTASFFALWLVAHLHVVTAPLPVIRGGFPHISENSEAAAVLTLKPMYVNLTFLHPLFDYCEVTPTALNISNMPTFHHPNCDAGFVLPITEVPHRLPKDIRLSRCYFHAACGHSAFNSGNTDQQTLQRIGKTSSSHFRASTTTDIQPIESREYRPISAPFMNVTPGSPFPKYQTASVRTSLVPAASHDAHTATSDPSTSSIAADLTESKAQSFKASLVFRVFGPGHELSSEQSAFPTNHALPEDVNSSMVAVLSSEVRWFGTFKHHSNLVVGTVQHVAAQLVPPFLRTLHFEFTDRLVNSFCAQLQNIPALYSSLYSRMKSHLFHENHTGIPIDALSNFSVRHLLTLSNTGDVPVFVSLLMLGPDNDHDDASFNTTVETSRSSNQDALTCVYSSFRLSPCVFYGNKSHDQIDSRSSFMILRPGDRVPLELHYQPDFEHTHTTASLWLTAFPQPQMRGGGSQAILLPTCDSFAACDVRALKLSVFRFSSHFPTDVLRKCLKMSPKPWIEQLVWTPTLLFASSLLVTIFMGSVDAHRIHTTHVKICNRMNRLSMNLHADLSRDADSSRSSSGSSSKRLPCDAKLSRTVCSQRDAFPVNSSSIMLPRRRHQNPLTFLFCACVSVFRLMIGVLKWACVNLFLLRAHQRPQRTGLVLSPPDSSTVSSFCLLKQSKELLSYFVDRFTSCSVENFTDSAPERMPGDRSHNEVPSSSHSNSCSTSGLKPHRNTRRLHSSNSSANSASHFPDTPTVIRRRRGYLKSDTSLTMQPTSELKIYEDTATSNCSSLLKDFPSSLPKAADTGRGEPVVARMTEAKIAAAVKATMRLAEESGHQGRRKTNVHKQSTAKKSVYFAFKSPSTDPLLASSRKQYANGRRTDSESSNPTTDVAGSDALNMIPASSFDDTTTSSAPKECSSSHPQHKMTSLLKHPNWNAWWPPTSVGDTHNSSQFYSSMPNPSTISWNDSVQLESDSREQKPIIPLGSILAHLNVPGRAPDRTSTASPAFFESLYESSSIPENAVDWQGTHLSSCWPRTCDNCTTSCHGTSQEHPVESVWKITRTLHNVREVGFRHGYASETPCLDSSVVAGAAFETETFAHSELSECSELVSNPFSKDQLYISPTRHQRMYTERASGTSRHHGPYPQSCLGSPTPQAFLYELPQITQTMRLSMLMHESRHHSERSEHRPATSESPMTERQQDDMKHDSNASIAYTKDLSYALYDPPTSSRSVHSYYAAASTLEHDHESAGTRQHPTNVMTASNYAVTYRPWVPISSLSRSELLDELGLEEIDSVLCNESIYPTQDHLTWEHNRPEIASNTVDFYTGLAVNEIGS